MKKLLGKLAFKMVGGFNGIVEMIGGIGEIIHFAFDWFNCSVLSRIKDKEEFAAYAEDVAQFGIFLDGVVTRHEKWMSETKRSALIATIGSVKELASALKDCKVEKSEIDSIISKVVSSMEAWKEAK